MSSPDTPNNIYTQMLHLVDGVSQELRQLSRRRMPDGTAFIDGDLAEQAITWEVIASATRNSIRRVQGAGADSRCPTLPFHIGFIDNTSNETLLKQSQEAYSFPEILKITMAIHGYPTGGQLTAAINAQRRKNVNLPPVFSPSAVRKWLIGTSLPTPHSFGEIVQALDADPESPLPIHALTAQLLYKSYENARREKDMQKRKPKATQRRKNLSHA